MASNVSNRSHAWGKRAVRKVFFTLLVCGLSGTGKTTFIETLTGQREPQFEKVSSKVPDSEMELYKAQVELDEDDGSRLALTVIDTPGFGLVPDASKDIEHLAEYIETRFDEVLAEESRIRRNARFQDNRVHACLYFIEPTGHGLREVDILTMARLASIVNVIPVLSRADQMTPAERALNKRLVLDDLRFHAIDTYDFGQYVDEDEENPDYIQMINSVRDAQPFAVVSSTEFSDDGRPLYRRRLPFGEIDITNPEQSDFILLRETVLNSFLADLKDATRDVLYEAYRTARLSDTNSLPSRAGDRSSLLTPEELAEHANRLKEAQLLRENQQLRENESKIAREIEEKRRQLLEREKELREIELRLAKEREQSVADYTPPSGANSSVQEPTSPVSAKAAAPSAPAAEPPASPPPQPRLSTGSAKTGPVLLPKKVERPVSQATSDSQFDDAHESADLTQSTPPLNINKSPVSSSRGVPT